MELETLVHAAVRLGYLDADATSEFFARTEEVSRLLKALMRALRQRASEITPVIV